jgi:hypothetical protein
MGGIYGQIDNSIKAIRGIEASWSLPELPDMVKLDLASMSGLTGSSVQGFLYALAGDFQNNQETEPVDEEGFITTPTYTPQQQARRMWTGTVGYAGDIAKDTVGYEGIQAWKQRAVRLGYLEQAELENALWKPEYNSIARSMGTDNYERDRQGAGLGLGGSVGEIVEFMDNWMSLTGLGEALTELDLAWDYDQIGKEWGRMGEKGPLHWLTESMADPNLISSSKKLWKALGPVDDVVVPVLNWALMFSGVGEVIAVGRTVHMSTQVATRSTQAFKLAHGANKHTGLLTRISPTAGRYAMESGDVLADVNRLASPGFFSGKMFPSVERVAELGAKSKTVAGWRQGWAAQKMARWREFPAVITARKGAQKTMQLGFTSRFEQVLGLDEGLSLADVSPTIRSATETLRSNPFAYIFAEALFTPQVLVQPGAITSPFGFVKNFKHVGNNAYYTEEFAGAVSNNILVYGDEAAELAEGLDAVGVEAKRIADAERWNLRVKEIGPTAALAERFTDGNVETLGGWMTWMAVMSSVDAEAAALASITKGISPDFIANAMRYEDPFLKARNNIISRLRYVDPDDDISLLFAMATERATDSRQVDRLMRKYWAQILNEPARRATLRKFVDIHNKQRQDFIQDLLGRHMTKGMLSTSIQEYLATQGSWKPFTEMSELVRETNLAGGMRRAHAMPAHSPETGMRVAGGKNIVPDRGTQFDMGQMDDGTLFPPEKFDDTGLTETDIPIQIGGGDFDSETHWAFDVVDVLDDPEFLDFANEKTFSIFNKPFSSTGKFTIARAGTPTAQEKMVEWSILNRLKVISQAARRVTNATAPDDVHRWTTLTRKVQENYGISAEELYKLKKGDWDRLLDEVVPLTRADGDVIPAAESYHRHAKRIFQYSKKHNVAPEDIANHVHNRLLEIDQSPVWASVHGINSNLKLEEKMAALHKQVAFTATEVDLDSIPEELAEALAENGYKLVHGVEFASTHDLTDVMIEISDLVEKGKYTDSFGMMGRRFTGVFETAEEIGLKAARGAYRSTQRWTQQQQTALYRATARNHLAKALRDQEGPHAWKDAGSADYDQLIDRLQGVARTIQEDMILDAKKARKEMSPYDVNRLIVNGRSAFIPGAAADLVRTNKIWSYVAVPKLKELGYTDDELLRIYEGLKRARVVGPELRGRATHWLDKVQAQPQLTSGLKLLGKTQISGQNKTARAVTGGAHFAARNVMGGGAAFAATANRDAYYEGDDLGDIPWFQSFGIGATAYAAGRMGGGKLLAKGINQIDAAVDAATVGTRLFPKNPLGLEATSGAGKILGGGTRSKMLPGRGLAAKIDETGTMKHWAYLGDEAAKWRDFFRFSLSPIFDASRYTEAMVLSQIGHIPASVHRAGGLRFNMSPTRWRRDRAREISGSKKTTLDARTTAQDEWDEIASEFAGIGRSRNDFDYEAMEAATQRFRAIGVLGFNTQEWMASLYADLTRLHGIERFKAYEISKKAFTYGLNPRSPMEMNVNAVFFPFSFTKKTFGHMANFMANDWSRAAMIHDAVKTYELLDEKYDLHDMWRDRMPGLRRLQRLNPFAYGATLGEAGGINRPFINALNGTPIPDATVNPILNLFLPQAHKIESDSDVDELMGIYRRVTPVINDMEGLMKDLKSQGHMMFGGTGLTERGEINRGYDKYNGFLGQLDDWMRNPASGPEAVQNFTPISRGTAGLGLGAAAQWADLKSSIKKSIENQYPAWKESRFESIGNSIARESEERELIAVYEAEASAGKPPSEMSRQAKVGYLMDWAKDIKRAAGNDMDAANLQQWEALMNAAAKWGKDSEYIRMKWNSNLRFDFGPIEKVLD